LSITSKYVVVVVVNFFPPERSNGKLHWNVCCEIPLTENQSFLKSNIGRVKYNGIDAMKGITLIGEDKIC
jgi:hypothetical protein